MSQNPYQPNHNPNSPDDYSRLYGNQSSVQTNVYSSQNISGLGQNQANYEKYYQSPAPVLSRPKEQKPKQPFSPIPLLLVAGVIFLFLGGVIFLTNTWDMLPDTIRAFSLLSASLIAFGANVLAERVFRLQKTGLAFYILGCIFLPMALGGIGVFHLLGDWFSFDGAGAGLLWAVICLSVSGSTYLGQKNYKNTVLVWLSLAGTAGAWISFSLFFCSQILRDMSFVTQTVIFGILVVLYAVAASILCEYYLRKHAVSYVTKAIPSFLYIVNLLTAIIMLPVSSDAKLAAGILSAVTAVLFCNYQFIRKNFHLGVFGSVFCMMLSLYQTADLFPDFSSDRFIFMGTVGGILFMALHKMPKLRIEFTQTYAKAGILLGGVTAFCLCFAVLAEQKIFFLLYGLLLLGVISFARSEMPALKEEPLYLILHCTLLFLTAEYTHNSNLLLLGLVLSALLLLIQAIIRRKLWMLSLAILTSGAVLLLNLEHSEITLLWLCAAGMFGSLIYANRTWRFVLERCCAWGFLAFLTPALEKTFSIFINNNTTAWILTLAVSGLLYLTETFIFWKDLRPNVTKPYLEMESLLLSFIATADYLIDDNIPGGFAFLLFLLLMVFAGGFLRKKNNAIAIPQLIMSFIIADALLHDEQSAGIKITLYLVLLLAYAGMGRLLLPNGFYSHEDGGFQIDWALLAGIMPVFGAAIAIDWYPSILTCLFLAVYSLLYIGRVENRFIPTLMASAFSCLTIFFHNVNDPFQIFTVLHDGDMKTPQVLLYVLPLHLFILSLLWILPPKHKETVHKARFAMYCFTMLCLLIVSLNFKNASDAILLMVFSFAILMGSFWVKKLRWFALGFTVLFLTTLRLTWKFWTSLHWGIYLFLAGIILIAVASYTEYKNRYYAEHPDEPKKKMEFFKTWIW